MAGFAAFAVCALLFVWREVRAAQRCCRCRCLRIGCLRWPPLVGLLVNVALYGLIFVLSLYFQQVNGLSAFETVLPYVPMMGAVLP